jgi:DNA-binding transcriptional LysR family regulator
LARDHPLAGARAQPLSAFRTEPFGTTSEQAFPGARQYMLKFCQEAGFEPRIIHEAQQPIDILNLVAMGECVALVPAQMRRIPHPGVVFRDLREPVLRADSYVAWKAENDSELLMDLVRAAKATYAQVMRKGVAP